MTTVMMTAATVMMTAERPDEAFSLSSLFPDSGECHPVELNPLQVTLGTSTERRESFKRMTLASLRSRFPVAVRSASGKALCGGLPRFDLLTS
jgi:hypothetical protein